MVKVLFFKFPKSVTADLDIFKFSLSHLFRGKINYQNSSIHASVVQQTWLWLIGYFYIGFKSSIVYSHFDPDHEVLVLPWHSSPVNDATHVTGGSLEYVAQYVGRFVRMQCPS